MASKIVLTDEERTAFERFAEVQPGVMSDEELIAAFANNFHYNRDTLKFANGDPRDCGAFKGTISNKRLEEIADSVQQAA